MKKLSDLAKNVENNESLKPLFESPLLTDETKKLMIKVYQNGIADAITTFTDLLLGSETLRDVEVSFCEEVKKINQKN